MFPGLHPAAVASMVPPLGMGMAFNASGLHHQPHLRLGNPNFLGGYYSQYNGVHLNKNSGSPQNSQAPQAQNNTGNSQPQVSLFVPFSLIPFWFLIIFVKRNRSYIELDLSFL